MPDVSREIPPAPRSRSSPRHARRAIRHRDPGTSRGRNAPGRGSAPRAPPISPPKILTGIGAPTRGVFLHGPRRHRQPLPQGMKRRFDWPICDHRLRTHTAPLVNRKFHWQKQVTTLFFMGKAIIRGASLWTQLRLWAEAHIQQPERFLLQWGRDRRHLEFPSAGDPGPNAVSRDSGEVVEQGSEAVDGMAVRGSPGRSLALCGV